MARLTLSEVGEMSLIEITACPLDRLALKSNSLDTSQSSLKLQHTANSSSVRKPSFPFLKNTNNSKQVDIEQDRYCDLQFTKVPSPRGWAPQKTPPSLRFTCPQALRKCSGKPERANRTEERGKSSKGVIWSRPECLVDPTTRSAALTWSP